MYYDPKLRAFCDLKSQAQQKEDILKERTEPAAIAKLETLFRSNPLPTMMWAVNELFASEHRKSFLSHAHEGSLHHSRSHDRQALRLNSELSLQKTLIWGIARNALLIPDRHLRQGSEDTAHFFADQLGFDAATKRVDEARAARRLQSVPELSPLQLRMHRTVQQTASTLFQALQLGPDQRVAGKKAAIRSNSERLIDQAASLDPAAAVYHLNVACNFANFHGMAETAKRARAELQALEPVEPIYLSQRQVEWERQLMDRRPRGRAPGSDQPQ